MQALFYMESTRGDSEDKLRLFCRSRRPSEKVRPFFLELVRGVAHGKEQIDRIIEAFSSNWKIGRMGGVDRNVMRIAVYEMLACDDIPPKVSINEAIDIGKKFGTEESGAFINGILDGIHTALEKGELRFSRDGLGSGPISSQPDSAGDRPPAPVPEPPRFVPVKGKRGVVKRTPGVL